MTRAPRPALRRVLVACSVIGTLVGITATSADAAWRHQSTGATSAVAGRVQPPGTAAGRTVTSAGTHLTWSAPTQAPAPTGYTVTRGGATVCTTTATSCDETNLKPATTYTYLVHSRAGSSWVSVTPLTITATTTAGSFSLSNITPTTVTAGTALTFTLDAVTPAHVLDPAYTGNHLLTLSTSIEASLGGVASGATQTGRFTAGRAAITTSALVAAGTNQILTVSDGTRTGTVAIAVKPAAAANIEAVNADGSALVCADGDHLFLDAGQKLVVAVAAADGFGNPAPSPVTQQVSVTVSAAVGTLSTRTLTLTSGAMRTAAVTVTGKGGSGTLSFAVTPGSIGPGSVTCYVN